MNKSEINRMENELRERLMKERWQKTAEQEGSNNNQIKYAIKVPVDDGWLYVTETDKDGNLIARTFDTREEAEALKDSIDYLDSESLSQVVEYHKDALGNTIFKLTEEEIEELRVKKQTIKEELYDKVKMEMFEASSKLEGIDYDKIPSTITNLTNEELQGYAWWLYKRVGELERERKFSKVSRVEVIGEEGREYVRYFEKGEEFMRYELQDDDRTLKIFIEKDDDVF